MTPQNLKGYFKSEDGTEIFYRSWPSLVSPTKAVLIFIHGLGEHSGRYRSPALFFSRLGFTVYAMDLRGHGQSKGVRTYAESMAQMLGDIKKFIQHVSVETPHLPFFLIGHSFGGQLVINYGLHSNGTTPKNFKGILVSSPNISLKISLPFLKRIFTPLLAFLFPKLSVSNELDPSWISRDASEVKKYREDPLVQSKITTKLADLILANQQDLLHLAKEFRIPIFLMHAGDDKICSPQGTREFFEQIPIRDKSFKVYEGYYHELFNEVDREKVFRDMKSWIEKRI